MKSVPLGTPLSGVEITNVSANGVRAGVGPTESTGSVARRFEAQARLHAERPAVRSGDRALTYAELNRAANRVANALLARRGPESEPIALLLEPGIDAVVGLLGILKAGKFYVPLDPSYPRARLALIVADAEPPLIVTDDAHLDSAASLAGDPGRIVSLDSLDGGDADPCVVVSPESLVWILYTSGSSGQPKGAVQTQRTLLQQIAAYTEGLDLGPHDRLTLLHSHCFSASRLDIFAALLNGATLCHYDVRTRGPEGLAGFLREAEITVFHWVPTSFRHFAGSLNAGHRFGTVRFVVLGSETSLARDVELHRRHFPAGCVLVNRFGTTETGSIAWHFVGRDTALPDGAVPIGRAVEGVEVLLLDEAGEEVATGDVGEIVVESRFLPPGYWRRPELTQAAFSSGRTGTGRYRTGDLAYCLGDGSLVYAGRKDLQAKIRGYRVEIAEIEDALLAYPGVAGAAVGVGEDESGAQRLLACLVPADDDRPTAGALRAHLGSLLPGHMIPATFTWLKRLPLTPTGKLDRRALAPLGDVGTGIDRAFVEPRTPVERALSAIWSQVLGVPRVGVDDGLLELGGDSLSAARIVQRVKQVFGVPVKLRELFDSPTVARMAEIICRERAHDLDAELGKVVSGGFMSEGE